MSRLTNNEQLSNSNFRFHNLYLVIHDTPYREFIDFGTGKTFAGYCNKYLFTLHI